MILKLQKESFLKAEYTDIVSLAEPKIKKALILATEKGSSCWLTALPLKNLGYSLNRAEFRDALYLRYNWRIPNTPAVCACGKPNDTNHTLNCKTGGFVSLRHNILRDTEVFFLKNVCKDVRTEPELLPVEGEPGARLDISANGVWSALE